LAGSIFPVGVNIPGDLMNVTQSLPLLGGLSPQGFMQQFWQKKPLLVRQAIADFKPLLDRHALFELAGHEEAQARMVIQDPGKAPGWRFKQGPFQRRALPSLKQPCWTMLIQGVDLHDESVHQLMNQFRFVPDARLDDLMISFATEGGGVGPHIDSYDVFLLQAQGQRRWRIGRQKDLSLQPNVPLKILANFVAEDEFVLDPGDMLYLPPGYAHDGIAVSECMTYSIGFRSPNKADLVRELLQRLADGADSEACMTLYHDPDQPAVDQAAAIPVQMLEFAQTAVQDVLNDPMALARGLGEAMTEPKPTVWFESLEPTDKWLKDLRGQALCLDRRTKMLFDLQHIFINGESFVLTGTDAALIRSLANERCLPAKKVAQLSAQSFELLVSWAAAGWLHGTISSGI
jgi:50S ribosomal protein L16 3-hydroxylase